MPTPNGSIANLLVTRKSLVTATRDLAFLFRLRDVGGRSPQAALQIKKAGAGKAPAAA